MFLKKDYLKIWRCCDVPILASSPGYGNNDWFDLDKFSEVLPEAWYDDPAIGKKHVQLFHYGMERMLKQVQELD